MKKVLLCLLTLFILTGCSSKDASKFKKDYESINGMDTGNGYKYRELSIPEDNPFIYINAEDLVKKIDNKESFIVYFGFIKCPWCRSVINNVITIAQEQKIDKIYYVDVYDIRSKKEIDETGSIKTTTKGTKGYYDLLDRMSNVLSDYTLTSNDVKVDAGEKRIFAPNIVSVVNGKSISLTTAISDKLKNPYDELTTEINNDSKKMLADLFKEYKDKTATCSVGDAC